MMEEYLRPNDLIDVLELAKSLFTKELARP